MKRRSQTSVGLLGSRWFAVWLLMSMLFPRAIMAADDSGEIRRAVTGFYNLYIKIRPQGIPQQNELAKFRRYFSPELTQKLRRAQQAEQQYQKANHGAVPPLIEGDLFTSLFEGASAFRLLSCGARGDAAWCEIEFTAIDPKDRSLFKWKDKIYLVRQSHRWLLDDVEYLGNWEFMHKGRLKTVLGDAINDSR